MPQRVIQIHADAPAKPPHGAACNGCGVCCSAEPCPLGCWLSQRRSGACVALAWNSLDLRYECGALAQPGHWLRWLPGPLAQRLVHRWIAAGKGCDSDYQPASVDEPEHVGS